MLVTPFNETDAFKLGIIDENGKVLKKASKLTTHNEKDAYDYLTRFVFNMKRMINKFGGENRLKSLAAALYLFKECKEILQDDLIMESYEDSLEDMFFMLMEDEYLELDTKLVESFLVEEMVTTDALPKVDGKDSTQYSVPSKIKLKDLKDLLRRKKQQ
jgi:hypothetical protein